MRIHSFRCCCTPLKHRKLTNKNKLVSSIGWECVVAIYARTPRSVHKRLSKSYWRFFWIARLSSQICLSCYVTCSSCNFHCKGVSANSSNKKQFFFVSYANFSVFYTTALSAVLHSRSSSISIKSKAALLLRHKHSKPTACRNREADW